MRKTWILGAALTVASSVNLAGVAAAQVEVGDEVSHKFRNPIENGMGLAELADLRGRPVIVEFWGTR